MFAHNALRFATALADHKVLYELHIFGSGVHGLSLADETTDEQQQFLNAHAQRWIDLALKWLKGQREMEFIMSTPITPADFPQIRWRGRWIWVGEDPIAPSGFLSASIDPQAPEAHGLFRRTVHLNSAPDRVPARITADSRYALFINKQEVYGGLIRSQPRRILYDLFDLAPYLQAGENIIAVYVKYYGTPKSYWMPAVPNLTLGRTGILVFEADLGGGNWLLSDASWKARKFDAWSQDWRDGSEDIIEEGVPIEAFDARRFPHDWRDGAFDDSNWGTAQVVPAVHIGGFAHTQPPTDPYGPLYPRPIAKLCGERKTPATMEIETLDGQVDLAIGSPVKRVAAAVALPSASEREDARLPLTFNLGGDNSAESSSIWSASSIGTPSARSCWPSRL